MFSKVIGVRSYETVTSAIDNAVFDFPLHSNHDELICVFCRYMYANQEENKTITGRLLPSWTASQIR